MNTYILVKLCKCEIYGHPFRGCPIPSATVNNPLKRSGLTLFYYYHGYYSEQKQVFEMFHYWLAQAACSGSRMWAKIL